MVERHAQRAGLVTNVNPHGWGDRTYMDVPAFLSQTTCGRPACTEKAIREVAAATNMTARFYPDTPMGGQFKDGPHEWTLVADDTERSAGGRETRRLTWECDEHKPSERHRTVTIVPPDRKRRA